MEQIIGNILHDMLGVGSLMILIILGYLFVSWFIDKLTKIANGKW